jgi:hypothetical protein
MGNHVKNRLLESGSTSVVIPSGTSAQRPLAPTFGQIRFNLDSGVLEFFNGSIFQNLGVAGSISYTVDSFTGDGSTTVFTMSETEALATQIIVFVGSIYQDPASAYTVDGGFDITFTSPPPSGETISVIHSNT